MIEQEQPTPFQIVRRVATRILLLLAALQALVAGTLVIIDALRKRKGTNQSAFPHHEPIHGTVGDNNTTIYTFGEHLYDQMLERINSAQHSVYLETYIWKNDEIGQAFKDAIVAAARRGVEVFVIYDGFANLVVPRSFLEFPAPINVIRYPVFRPAVLLLNIRHSGRDHRKLLVVDDEYAFVGGYNIGSLYATEWRDTHLELSGPAVWDLRNAFVDFWNAARSKDQPILPDPGSPTWNPQIQIARNAPSHLLFPIRGLYLEAIDRAKKRIYITQAYFIPDHEILDALLAAARRGVDVRVIMPEVSNHVVTDWLSRGFYSTLLRGGVTIWLFQNAMVHAKTATVDGQWTTIGTANIDRLSLSGNYEINVEIYNDSVASQMEDVFETDLSNCRELTIDEWDKRSSVARFSEAVLAPLRPLL